MDQQAEASEPAPSLQPATQMRRERDLLPRDPQDGLSWHEHQPISRVDLFCDRLIVRLLGNPNDLPGLAEDTKLRSKVQVHRCRSDRCGVVWVDPNVTSRNLPEDLISGEDAHLAFLLRKRGKPFPPRRLTQAAVKADKKAAKGPAIHPHERGGQLQRIGCP